MEGSEGSEGSEGFSFFSSSSSSELWFDFFSDWFAFPAAAVCFSSAALLVVRSSFAGAPLTASMAAAWPTESGPRGSCTLVRSPP